MRIFAAAAALVTAAALGVAADVSPEPPAPPPPVAASPLSQELAATAERGVAVVWGRWGWRGWLRVGPYTRDWAPLWQTIHLAMAAEGLAAATGAEVDRRRVRGLLRLAEGYWNARIGGYAGRYATRGRAAGWFDDNGWLGLAFVDAYRQTGDARFLRDARRALAFILSSGWDARDGGIWWNDAHEFKSGESVVTAALLAVRLQELTGDSRYLADARRIVDWTNAHLFDASRGLYVNRPGGGPISYLQSPMLDALGRLCRFQGLYCARLRPLADATFATYGGVLDHAPQYDAMYLRFLVDAREVVADPRLTRLVRANALVAMRRAAGTGGIFDRDWHGGNDEAPAGWLQTHAATLEALAWAAALRAS
jgi:hypothetical protein